MRLLALASLSVAVCAAGQSPEYFKDIRPILQAHCAGCHNHSLQDKPQISAGLALDTYDGILRGGARAIIETGDAARSPLLLRVTSADPAVRMPKGGPPLDEAALKLLQAWIEGGAKKGEDPVLRQVSADSGDSPLPASAVKPTNVFIPFGGRKPVEAPPESSKETNEVIEVPGALHVEEEEAVERLTTQPYREGLQATIGPLPPVTALAFSPDGKLLLTGFYGRVTVWNLAARRVVREISDMAGSVNGLAFSPNGKLLALAGGKPYSGGEIRLYDARDFHLLATLAAHHEVVLAQAFSPDSGRLATAAYDKTVEIWDVSKRTRIAQIKDHSDAVNCLAFDPQGKLLATGSMDRTVKISDGVTGKGILTISPELKSMLAVAFSPDGKFVVTAGESPEIRWWELAEIGESVTERGWKPARRMTGHWAAVYDLRFSPDGSLLASAGADNSIRLWDGKTGRALRALIDSDSLLYSLAFSPDSKQIASAGADGFTHVWDLRKGALQLTLSQKAPSPKEQSGWLAVSPDGNFQASPEWTAIVRPVGVRHAKN